MQTRRHPTPPAPLRRTNALMCHECEKLWFGTASRGNVARECPDCGSRLTLLEGAARPAAPAPPQ